MKKILETERLYLREFETKDATGLYELNQDPEVLQYTGDKPFSDVRAAENFIRDYDHYRKYGFGRWAVVRKRDEAFLGYCGLKFQPEYGEVDLGYRFFKRFWGSGYATEAAKGCLKYGFESLNLKLIIGRAMDKNLGSISVLQKSGMVYWKEIICAKNPGVCYRIENTITARN